MPAPLIALHEQGFAYLLANYLRSQGIGVQVAPTEQGQEWLLQLTDETDLERARQICEEFLQRPTDPKYQQAAWQSGEQVALQRSASTGSGLSGVLSWCRSSPFTAAILVLCSLIFGLSLLGWFAPLANALMMQPLPVLMESQQWWRLLGPAFLHFSVVHFVFNLLWWCMLGGQIERKMGVTMLLLVFVVSAIASNLGQAIVSGPNFGGLSGVVYALLGFVWWTGWLKPHWGLQLPKAVIGFMLVWLVLGYADILWVSMANTAHTVGLISGCVLAAILSLGADRSRKPG